MTLRLCADLLISADKISKIRPHRQEHITKNFKIKNASMYEMYQKHEMNVNRCHFVKQTYKNCLN